MNPPTAIDVHQHLLGEALVEELERRTRPPMLVRRRQGWTFKVPAEPDSVLTFDATDVDLRREDLGEDGIDLALVALSSALGIETLPVEESRALIDSHHRDIEGLPPGFGGWGAVPLAGDLDPADVDLGLDRGCVGISLPAASLADPGAVERLHPLLARVEAHGAPLFVHPGPVGGALGEVCADPARLPHWWPALTDYVAQMHRAWFAFLHAGRRAHPRLRIVFAMLAGGAPLHLERYAGRRGVPAPDPDPLVFYDTSSYGPRMIAAVGEAVGVSQLVYGSDRPVLDPRRPRLDPDLRLALVAANPARLLHPDPKGALA
jgi:hypothetical protein